MSGLGPVVVGVEGTELGAADRERLSHPLVGMVILFASNYESPEQLQRLTADIHALRASAAADRGRSRRRTRAAIQAGLHAPAADARSGQAVGPGRPHGVPDGRVGRLRAGGRAARSRGRLLVHAGARPRSRTQQRDRRSRLPLGSARRHAARLAPDARPATGRHGELRQALPGAWLAGGGFPRRHSARSAPVGRDTGCRRRAVPLARPATDQRDARACGVRRGRPRAGRVLVALDRSAPRASWNSPAPSSATTC